MKNVHTAGSEFNVKRCGPCYTLHTGQSFMHWLSHPASAVYTSLHRQGCFGDAHAGCMLAAIWSAASGHAGCFELTLYRGKAASGKNSPGTEGRALRVLP